MAERRGPRVFVWFLVGLLVLVAGTGGVLYVLVQQEDARWPSLAETPRVSAPIAPVTGDGRAWEQLESASEAFPSDAPDFDAILAREGTPSADVLMAWRPFATRIDILRAVVTDTSGLTVPQPARFDDPGVSLLPFLKLSRAWLLSGWAHAAGGAPARGVAEMLHVQALGVRFMEGSTGLVDTMVGLAIHERARRELRELLETFGAADPMLYTLAADGLVPLEPGAVARALVVEANGIEAMFATQRADMGLVEAWGYDEELTRVWYRLQMQRVVSHAVTPRWERTPLEGLPLWDPDGGLVQQLHNRTGRILLDLASANYAMMIAKEDAAIASSRLDVLRVAVRRYALDHAGALPTSQAELVPDYLPATQIDPYDGEPLRLDGESVWSVGEPDAPEGAPLRLPLAPPAQRE